MSLMLAGTQASSHSSHAIHRAFPFLLKSSCRFPGTWFTWGASICFWWRQRARWAAISARRIAYWIGARGGRPLVERYGSWVLMSHHDLDRMTRFFEKYGSIAILLGRMMPIVQTFVAFPAGIAKMPRLRFHIYTTLGSLVWYFCLAWAGMKLGQAWHTDPRLEQAFHRFHVAVELAVVAAFVWFLWSHLKRRSNVEAARD